MDAANAAEKRKSEKVRKMVSIPMANRQGKDRFAGLSRRKKRSKLMREEIAKENAQGEMDAAVRAAKRAQRPKELGVPVPKNQGKPSKKKRPAPVTKRGGSAFAEDMGARSGGRGAASKPAKRQRK